MALVVENVSEDEVYGFKREEMCSGTLACFVRPYGRHVFLCYKSHETSLPRVATEGLPQRFAKSFKDSKADFGVVTNLNVCGGGESDGDVLIFLEMVIYKYMMSLLLPR